MRTVNIHAAKTHLSRLVEAAAAGEEIIIAKSGKPLARLAPLDAQRTRRKLGILAGKIQIPDAPLPEDVLADFEAP
jgi:prevent-host-death family protein